MSKVYLMKIKELCCFFAIKERIKFLYDISDLNQRLIKFINQALDS